MTLGELLVTVEADGMSVPPRTICIYVNLTVGGVISASAHGSGSSMSALVTSLKWVNGEGEVVVTGMDTLVGAALLGVITKLESASPAHEIGANVHRPGGDPVADQVINARRKPNLTVAQRRSVLDHLLTQVHDPNNPISLYRGALTNVAILFNVTRETISTLWHHAVQSEFAGNLVLDVTSRKAGRVGRKKIKVDVHALKAIQLKNRKNMQSITTALGVSKNNIQRAVKVGDIVPHTNAIKSFLTDVNKIARVKFCLSMLDPNSLSMFQNMMDMIHIDEKWFFLTEQNARFYLAPSEEPPHRTCKSKKFITKVMFMAIVALPRFDTHRNSMFEGKIGIFPFIFKEPAKRIARIVLLGQWRPSALSPSIRLRRSR